MASAETRGDGRTKPVWGSPPPSTARGRGPAPADGGDAGSAARSKSEEARRAREEARLARAQAKAARAEAKALARAQRRQRGAEEARGGRPATAAALPTDGRPAARQPARGPSTGRPAVDRRAAAPPSPTAAGSGVGRGGAAPAPAGAAVAAAAGRGGSGARPAAKGAKAPAKVAAKGGGRTAPPAKRPAGPAKRPGGKRPAPRSRAGAFQKRYAVVHDIEGPRVRLGIAWFVLALGGIFAGPVSTAAVYGGAAAVAAAQTTRVWRKQRVRPNQGMAAGGALLVAFGACFGAGGAGLGLLGAVALAFVGAAGDPASPNPRLADVGWTLQVALPVAVVAMSMVLLTRIDQGSAVALLLLVSAFETGDFLIGSGARNPYEGPAAGTAAIVVVTFIVSTLPISTLSFGEAWLLGGAVAVLAPVGQLVASALLPSAKAPASALRRLDSLLVAAPLWAWAVGIFD